MHQIVKSFHVHTYSVSRAHAVGRWSTLFSKYLDTSSMGASNADTKIVSTVSAAERLLRDVFDDGTRKPLTITQYCTRVMRLFNGMHDPKEDFESLDWVKDTAAILEYVRKGVLHPASNTGDMSQSAFGHSAQTMARRATDLRELVQQVHCRKETDGGCSANPTNDRA